MKYKLYTQNADINNSIQTIIQNRGIEDYQHYLNLKETDLIDYVNLNNILEAVQLFEKHYTQNNTISILVDTDPDGYCSAAIMYMYIKQLHPDYDVNYIMHNKAKSHGLDDNIKIPENTKLFIIPDAGTNDTEECRVIKESGIDILILDHHEQEKENPYALIVNNQISSKYSNKNLCGAGVVYKFLQALDDYYWVEFADKYLDLVALANISDSMNIKSFETRYLISKGLKQITNKFFKALLNAQEYSTSGIINIHNIQWFITPVINGMIRVGKNEEKDLLFRAFIERDEYFDYKKRATKNKPAKIIKEDIYTRAARLSKNAKARQDKMKNKSIPLIQQKVDNNNKFIIVDCTDILDTSLTGVVAIKIAEIYNKPCILLQKHTYEIVEDNKPCTKVVYGGSARNIDYSPITSFKDVVNQNVFFEWGQGHPNAFGVQLPIENLPKAIKQTNELLKDVEYDKTYNVDYILDVEELNAEVITQFDFFKDYIGQGFAEPLIAIPKFKIHKDIIEVIGKTTKNIVFTYNDIKYIKFKCNEQDEIIQWLDSWDDMTNTIEIELVGKPTINIFQNIKTMQIEICNYNILKTYVDNNHKNEQDDEFDDIW